MKKKGYYNNISFIFIIISDILFHLSLYYHHFILYLLFREKILIK